MYQSAVQFDEILQHVSTSAPSSEAAVGRKVLPLRHPERRILPGVERRLDLVNPGLLEVFRALVTGQAPWPLYVHGPTGAGKTMAVLCLCDIAETACYWPVEDLCDFIMRESPVEVQGEFRRVAEKGLAVLDELGQRATIGDLHYSAVKRFADARELHAGRVAIYISNLAPKVFAELYDDRIWSRVLCGTRYELAGDDRRCSR